MTCDEIVKTLTRIRGMFACSSPHYRELEAVLTALHASPVGAEPSDLVAMVQEWQAARRAAGQVDRFGPKWHRFTLAESALLAWTPAQAEPAAPVTDGAACEDCGLAYVEFPLDVVLPRGQWLLINPDDDGLLCAGCIVKRASGIPGCTVVHAVLEIAPATPSARPTPAVGAEPPALSDQFDGWIVHVPNRSFTSVYGLFVGYDEAIAWRCRSGYDADNSHVYPIRRVEADNAAPPPAAVPTEQQP